MKATVSRSGEVTIVQLDGKINYETVDPFRSAVEKYQGEKIVFNLQNLSFVGSSGITPFIDAIEIIARRHPEGIKLCGVGSEFKKMFAAKGIEGLEIYDDLERAQSAFYHFHPTEVDYI